MRRAIAKPIRWAPVALWVAIAGCATYAGGLRPMLDPLRRGDPDEALARLEKSPRTDDALYHLERGLLLRLTGRLRESSRAFDEADRITEDLYTKSVSQEAAALALSDRIRPYRPLPYERLLARHYQIRNYLEEGDGEGALVEARRCEQLMNELQDAAQGSPIPWIPAVYLSAAIAHEAAGRPDDALRLYRRLVRDGGEAAGALPDWIPRRVHRLARIVGVTDEDLALPLPSGVTVDAENDAFTSVIWIERGFVPPREEVRLRVPILKSEAAYAPEQLGAMARDRALEIRTGLHPHRSRNEIAYWLEVALPKISPRVRPEGTVWAGKVGERIDGAPAAEIGWVAQEALEAETPTILLRTLIRAIIKYGATRQAAERGGEVGGFLANLLGAATESAETRMWLSLPDRIDLIVAESPEPIDALPVGWGEPVESFRRLDLRPLPSSRFRFGSCRDRIEMGELGGSGS